MTFLIKGSSIKDVHTYEREWARNNADKSGQGERGLNCVVDALFQCGFWKRRGHLEVILSLSSSVED